MRYSGSAARARMAVVRYTSKSVIFRAALPENKSATVRIPHAVSTPIHGRPVPGATRSLMRALLGETCAHDIALHPWRRKTRQGIHRECMLESDAVEGSRYLIELPLPLSSNDRQPTPDDPHRLHRTVTFAGPAGA